MRTEPIPNDDPRCHCILGKAQDEDAVIMHGPEDIVISAYANCPLHGEWIKFVMNPIVKGLGI